MGGSDNDIFIMIISATVVLLILLVFIVSFLFIYSSRRARYHAEMEAVKEKYNQEILMTQLEIKEQTMKSISEEIHDNVGQVLSLVVLNLSGIELADPDKAAMKIENSTKLVQKAVSDLRNLSKTLDGENIADLGLSAIVKFELELLEKSGAYNTSFQLLGEDKRMSRPKELILYRIIQESLNNIIKHARASLITVRMNFSGLQLEIEITDNGKGFNLSDMEDQDVHSRGAGIRNMKKRVHLIGGTFEITSAPLKGTVVSMTVPAAD